MAAARTTARTTADTAAGAPARTARDHLRRAAVVVALTTLPLAGLSLAFAQDVATATPPPPPVTTAPDRKHRT